MADLKIIKSSHGDNIEYHLAIVPPLGSEVKIHSVLLDVVVPLARRHPEWLFVSSEWSGTRFQVYENKEHLGTLSVDYRASRSCVGISSDRIRSNLQRDVMIRTSDAKKARKLVETNFSINTPKERTKEAVARALSATNALMNTTSRDLMRADTTLTESFKSFLASTSPNEGGWMGFAARMCVTQPSLPSSTRALREKSKELYKIRASGTVVHLYGGNYLLMKVGSTVTTLSEAELTPRQKTLIGLMKLSADGDYVPDVGVRVSSDTFMVVDLDEPQS